nr:protein TOPLESS-like isoform X1 [Ipomoea batatas]
MKIPETAEIPEVVSKLEGHLKGISCLAFSNALNVLILCGIDAQIGHQQNYQRDHHPIPSGSETLPGCTRDATFNLRSLYTALCEAVDDEELLHPDMPRDILLQQSVCVCCDERWNCI